MSHSDARYRSEEISPRMSGNVSKLCPMKIGDFVCLLSDVHALSELPWTALMFLDFRATAVTLWHWAE